MPDSFSTPLRIGVLGCGPIAQAAHLESVQKARDVVLAAVCDRDEELATTFGAFHGARRIHTEYDELLADDGVDAVVVATADSFHVPAARRALAAGKHVLCEKPLGVTVEEVEALREDVARTGLVLRVGHMLRFDPGIQEAHRFVRDEIGEVLALKAWYCDSTHRYTMTDALQPVIRHGTHALRPDGDPRADRQRYLMLAHGSHLVDLARHLAGPIVAVQARFLERAGALCWFVTTTFESGALGHLDLTVPVRMDWHEGFQLYGEHGSVLGRIHNPWYLRASEVDVFREEDATWHRVLGADGHHYRRQLEGFADAVRGDATTDGATVEDGVASVRAMAAIARSVRSGAEVALADVSGPV